MKNWINKHIEKFGVEPVIIGINWNNPEEELNGIIEAIENNKPYNEYDLLSEEEREAFDNGDLVF